MLYRLNYLIQRCFEEIRSDAVSTELPYQNYTKRVSRRKLHCLRTSLSLIMTNLHQTNLHQNYTKRVSRRKLHCLRTSLSLIMTIFLPDVPYLTVLMFYIYCFCVLVPAFFYSSMTLCFVAFL